LKKKKKLNQAHTHTHTHALHFSETTKYILTINILMSVDTWTGQQNNKTTQSKKIFQ